MKKVLASVLAGSMVLGMASMASAASLVVSKKSSSSDSLAKIEIYETEGSALDKATIQAANDYIAKYEAYVDNKNDLDNAKALLNAFGTLNTKIRNDDGVKNSAKKTFSAKMDKITNTDVGTLGTSGTMTVVASGFTANDLTAAVDFQNILDLLPTAGEVRAFLNSYANGDYTFANKTEFELKDEDGDWYNLFNFGEDDTKEITVLVPVGKGDDLRVDVLSGKVTVSTKKVAPNGNVDQYELKIKANAGVRDFETDDFKIEVDCEDADAIFYIKGKVAYSDWQEVNSDDRYFATKKSKFTADHDRGCVFKFDEKITTETRIVCNDYVDLYFDGNYGTDFENLRVMTDDIKEVEDFFQDYDIDYYDFIGTPKFAKDVKIIVDADDDAYIYEFDKKTGDVVDITDECERESDGFSFKRKTFKTYVVLEEPYEGGNVRADKEPVDDEPTEPDDTDATGSKPNPGTGAMPF